MVNWSEMLHFKFLKKQQEENKSENITEQEAKHIMWRDSFESMLKDGEGFELFREYLLSQYCDENLDFWKAVEDFRINNDDSEIYSQANTIYCKYIMKGAPRCINLRSKSRDKLSEMLNSKINRTFFDESQKEIVEVMQRDPFQRFLRSEIYRNLCT